MVGGLELIFGLAMVCWTALMITSWTLSFCRKLPKEELPPPTVPAWLEAFNGHLVAKIRGQNFRSHFCDGAGLIQGERWQQQDKCGWTDQHDDGHKDGELIQAAAYYLELVRPMRPVRWPWAASGQGPTPGNDISDLAKAGALIAAEIDRRQRIIWKNSAGRGSGR